MSPLNERAADNLAAVRSTAPLVHNITNFVVMNLTANALLAVGASPVMAHAEEEVEEMVALAGAVVLNIGTLSRDWVPAMLRAGRTAQARGKPVVLDPVGAGATRFRTETASRILQETGVHILRGNASEILAVARAMARNAGEDEPDSDIATRGVEAVHPMAAAAAWAERLANRSGVVVAVTGPTDLVTDGSRNILIRNGHPLMSRITGAGCTASAIVAAFAAVDPDPMIATATGLAVFGLAGEIAGVSASGPGTFMIGLLDVLYTLTPDRVLARARIEAP